MLINPSLDRFTPNRWVPTLVAASLAFGSSAALQAAIIRAGDVTTVLGPTFFLDNATDGGGDVDIEQPGAPSYVRSFDGLLTRNQGPTRVTLTGFGFAAQTMRGVLWMQGESDATAAMASSYQANLTELIAALRADIGAIAAASGGRMTRSAASWSELDVFVGTVQNSNPNRQTVINAQNAVAAADANVFTVNGTTGLSMMTSDDWGDNGVHYDTAGQVLLGERFADAAISRIDSGVLVSQTVTVTAVNDTVVESNHSGMISHGLSSLDLSFGGLPINGVTAAVIDNDANLEVDTDGDGLSDLLEYAFATSPGTPNGSPFRVIAGNAGTITLGFPWNRQAAGLNWQIRHGQDLANRAAWPVVAPGLTTITPNGDIDRITVAPAMAYPDRGFYILEVIGN